MDDTVYQEGIYVGYRYFDTAGVKPTFPFGYGLSYTTFSLETAEIHCDENEVKVQVKVTNTGKRKGKEVVQLYSSSPSGKLDKPYQELRAFGKTGELAPGESETVCVSYATSDMASYDVSCASYLLEAGDYILRVGASSADTMVCGVVSLDETAVIRKCKNIGTGAGFMPKTTVYRREEVNYEGVKHFHLKAASFETDVVAYSKEPELIASEKTCDYMDVREGRASLDDFVAGLSNEELALLCVGMHDPKGGMGSMIGAAAKSVEGAAGETTDRLTDKGVPTIVMADGPAGIRISTQCTAIPIGTAVAQSFSKKAYEDLGDIVGEEMEMFGIHLWLAPAMNIHRSPLCGRDFEYFSEDPVVSGLAAASIDKGIRRHKGCGTTIKHFALNHQETNRVSSNSIADERTIREIYLKNFEICIRESAPAAIMSSYNLVNGEHVNNSRDLLTYVLRDEWQYEGLVMTDWYAVGSMIADLIANSTGRKNKHGASTPEGCIYAGNDLIMPGIITDYQDIVSAIDHPAAKYPINRPLLQTCAKRVLKTILELRFGEHI